jgi:hypothetical protein
MGFWFLRNVSLGSDAQAFASEAGSGDHGTPVLPEYLKAEYLLQTNGIKQNLRGLIDGSAGQNE